MRPPHAGDAKRLTTTAVTTITIEVVCSPLMASSPAHSFVPSPAEGRERRNVLEVRGERKMMTEEEQEEADMKERIRNRQKKAREWNKLLGKKRKPKEEKEGTEMNGKDGEFRRRKERGEYGIEKGRPEKGISFKGRRGSTRKRKNRNEDKEWRT